jgi:hypothetical protein
MTQALFRFNPIHAWLVTWDLQDIRRIVAATGRQIPIESM